MSLVGLNLSHDASLTIHDSDGFLVFAAQEERYSREKQDGTFPFRSLQRAIEGGYLRPEEEVDSIVIGSHRNPNDVSPIYWINKLSPPAIATWKFDPFLIAPGEYERITKSARLFKDCNELVETMIRKIFEKYNIKVSELVFVAHEDAHSASGMFGSGFESGLSLSLDGSGDNESGVVQLFDNSKIRDLARIPATNSLGHAYSMVTQKYGFRPNHHEGKITGLAAFGKWSPAVDYLLQNIIVENGQPEIRLLKSKFQWIINRLLYKSNLVSNKIPLGLEQLIDIALSQTSNYPDLAFAIQKVLESRIETIVNFWIEKTGVRNVTLAGGVFANVRINELIANNPEVNKVYVFPNMGDGGLSAGGVWRYLSDSKKLKRGVVYRDMYLGTLPGKFRSLDNEKFRVEAFEKEEDLVDETVKKLVKGTVIGICRGRMEFGPRALCNRSIIVSPFDRSINESLNKRLRRTEFMPFAPVVMDVYASEVFDLTKFNNLVPFEFMTMTCQVYEKWKEKIPAAVHVDGTARPQIINRQQNPFVYKILEGFFKTTGVPVLINTSFNAHEEPIISDIEFAINSLKQNSIDYLVTDNNLISL